jgi:hypothetical protein
MKTAVSRLGRSAAFMPLQAPSISGAQINFEQLPIISTLKRRKRRAPSIISLYGVTTGNLNKAVRRNANGFPGDFMLQLTVEEAESSRFQFGSLKRGHNYKYLPCAFTEQGVAMLSGVLNSQRAVQVNVAIMRAFVRLRETLSLHKELAHKLAELERKVSNHDAGIRSLFEAIRQLTAPPPKRPKPEIGFHVKEDSAPYRIKKRFARP